VLDTDDSQAAGVPLSWRGFGFTYPGEAEPALSGLNLEVGAGQKVLVMGPSGCGKSTLGMTLNGIIPNSTEGDVEGEVRVDGVVPSERDLAEMAQAVGLVFQDPDSQLCTITVSDEITFGPQNVLLPEAEIRERLAVMARLVGMESRLDSNVFNLSGGQKQRVAIASTLVMEPQALVLDEPTANLDPAGRGEVLRVLRAILSRTDMTTIVVEHHPAELLAIIDRVVIMNEGAVALEGAPRPLFAERGRELLELGTRLPAATLFALGTGTAGQSAPLFVEELDFDRLVGPVTDTRPHLEPLERANPSVVPALSVEGVSFAYEKNGANVLQDLSFAVQPGEIVALMGSNGSGKSTTGSLLVGINRPTAGNIRVRGQDTRKHKVHQLARHVGFVFQYPEHQFVTDTVIGEVMFSLERLGRDAGDIRELALRELERFDLAHLADKHPFKLSLGQKRRLSIAAMSVYRPDVLVLDEPTFGQDQAHTDQLAAIIRSLRDDGTAILMITHDLRLTAELADRAIVLDAGRIVHDDSPGALLAHLHSAGPAWGLVPSDEYAIWHEVARRMPELPFTGDVTALAHEVRALQEVR
jgi:energy-coupling factor transport system ATP-binding protein